MRQRPYVSFLMCFTVYLAVFLVLGVFTSYRTAVETGILTQTEADIRRSRGLVMIDPGHGGIDGGATGVTGILEKELNLQVAKSLRQVLALFGVKSDLTRPTDDALGSGVGTIAQRKVEDMRIRLDMINKKPYDVVLSIHMNHYPEEKYWGPQVFYSGGHPESTGYAAAICKSLRTFTAPENKREAKRGSDDIYLLRHAQCPALIIECGFLSNTEENKLLETTSHQLKLAVSIAAGYLTYQNSETI